MPTVNINVDDCNVDTGRLKESFRVNTHARLDCEEEDFWITTFLKYVDKGCFTDEAKKEANEAIKAYRRAKAGNL